MTSKEENAMRSPAAWALLTEEDASELRSMLLSCPDETIRIRTSVVQTLLDMNRRVEVLQKHSLREKIKAFLNMYREDADCGFSIPLNREEMAEYLGCDRSALSRELARMSKDGIIEYKRNSFKVLK